MKDAVPSRKPIGPIQIAFLLLLLGFIAAHEYGWLMTPWWLKAVRLCGAGWSGFTSDLTEWLRW